MAPALKPCLDCGALSRASRCPIHRATGTTSWNNTRNRTAQATFRKHVLRAAANRCQWTDRNGNRCPATTDLQAHHTLPGNNDPLTGKALCRTHHRFIDPHAR